MSATDVAHSSARDQIRVFVLNRLAAAKGVTSFTDEESLMERGIIDSLGTFQLVDFLEQNFKIRISDDEITGENFDSIASIQRLVAHKSER